MAPIRIGFIGLSRDGWAASNLFPPLLTPPLADKYTLTALSTTSAASASESATKYTEITGHVIKAYDGDSSQIANDPDVDLVAVSVRVPGHLVAALPAIEAGKDLFIEWPLANGMAEVMKIAEAAKRKGIRSLIGLQSRQSPAVTKVKALIASEKIGRVIGSTVISNTPYYGETMHERNAYAVDAKNGAGLLQIPVGHFTDIFTWIFGDISSVVATLQTRQSIVKLVDSSGKPTGRSVPQTVADQIAFSGALKSGVLFSIHWRGGVPSSKGRIPFLWQIDGESGVIRVEGNGAILGNSEAKVFLNGEEIQLGAADELSNTGRSWLEFAKGTKGNYPDIDDAVKNHRLLDAIERSAKEGRRVDVD